MDLLSRSDPAVENISENEDTVIEVINIKQGERKPEILKINEAFLSDLQNSLKQSNVHILGVSCRESG